MFFGAGFCLLTAGVLLAGRWLAKLSRPEHTAEKALGSIGVRNVTRQPGRSLSVMGMMASGLFLQSLPSTPSAWARSRDPTRRDCPAPAAYALMGESTLPIYEDLNSEAAWDAFALDDKLMKKAHVVPFRVRQGDDASCLQSQTRPRRPRAHGGESPAPD